MGVPLKADVTQTGAGSSEWIPLNRWGSALTRVWATVTGTVSDYSIEGTTSRLNRGETPTAAEIQAIENFSSLSAAKTSTQNVMYEAVRVTIATGTGSVRLQLRTEGDC